MSCIQSHSTLPNDFQFLMVRKLCTRKGKKKKKGKENAEPYLSPLHSYEYAENQTTPSLAVQSSWLHRSCGPCSRCPSVWPCEAVGYNPLHITPGPCPLPNPGNFVVVLMHLMRRSWHGWPAWLSFLWSMNIYTRWAVYTPSLEIFFRWTASSYWDLCLPTCTAGKSKQQMHGAGWWWMGTLCVLAVGCTCQGQENAFSSVSPLLYWYHKFLEEEGAFVSIWIMHLSNSKQ